MRSSYRIQQQHDKNIYYDYLYSKIHSKEVRKVVRKEESFEKPYLKRIFPGTKNASEQDTGCDCYCLGDEPRAHDHVVKGV
jgi:hypothetical protein